MGLGYSTGYGAGVTGLGSGLRYEARFGARVRGLGLGLGLGPWATGY